MLGGPRWAPSVGGRRARRGAVNNRVPWPLIQALADVDGALRLALEGDAIVDDFSRTLDDRVERRYAGSRRRRELRRTCAPTPW